MASPLWTAYPTLAGLIPNRLANRSGNKNVSTLNASDDDVV